MLDIQIDRIHCSAVREEIGERLAVALGPQSDVLPARLLELMDRLAKVEALARRFQKFDERFERMKDFSNASFPPDTIEVMTLAMNAALAALPHPISSKYVQLVAETILRTAKDGERDPKALERMALLELKISPRL